MGKIIVVGGGAAGMMAAITAARNGHKVTLLEKNEKLGKKLYITGKGRCNLTNAGDMDTLFSNVITNRKFLYSAFYAYDNFRVIDFFENHGVKTKTERGNRVFPVSDHASDIIHALSRALEQAGVKVRLYTRAESILTEEGHCTGICLSGGTVEDADAVILATGGFSYQSTGSTGDGYRFAEECGHNITEIEPSLVPFTTKEAYILQLQGLSLKNVRVTIKQGKKTLFEEFGEMLFTHFGVSGPLILSASSIVGKKLKKQELFMSIDLKPALSAEQLDRRLLRDFEENLNRQFKNALNGLYPSKLISVMIERSGIDPEKKVNLISRKERQQFVESVKNLELTLTGLRDYREAVITKGGVRVQEIHPSTMESKLVKGLYFAGEVLDLDALTGGYNLQIAWSTGHLAGDSQ